MERKRDANKENEFVGNKIASEVRGIMGSHGDQSGKERDLMLFLGAQSMHACYRKRDSNFVVDWLLMNCRRDPV